MKPVWQPPELETWLQAIKTGALAAAPAEGMYGYVANPFNQQAVEAIHTAKQRPANKGFIVLVSDTAQLPQLCTPLADNHIAAIDACWQPHQPPITLILPVKPELTYLTGGLPSIAVRRAFAPHMLEYLNAAGTPLVSTSLNLSGQPPVLRAADIPQGITALTLPHALAGNPSRIYNPATNQWLR
jgi:L-threonylcarbamoyladenylate synthase